MPEETKKPQHRSQGYVRKVPRYPTDQQREALEAEGVNPIYVDSTPLDAIDHLRPGDIFCIAGSLRILANNREGIKETMEMIRDKGCSVRDILTDRAASDHGIEMMADAIREIANDRTFHLDQKAAAEKRWGTPKRMTLKDARKVWFNPSLTVADAIARMEGWTAGTAYRKLGKRNVPATMALNHED